MGLITRADNYGDLSILTGTTMELQGAPYFITVAGQQFKEEANLQLDTGTVGLGGLDTGVLTANSRYRVFLVRNGGVNGLMMSLSDSPSGILAYVKIGEILTDATPDMQFATNDINFLTQKSIPTAWCKFDSDNVIDDRDGNIGPANIVGLGGTARRIDFLAPMADTNYGILCTNDDYASGASAGTYVIAAGKLTTSFQIRTVHHPANTQIDHNHMTVQITGKLA